MSRGRDPIEPRDYGDTWDEVDEGETAEDNTGLFDEEQQDLFSQGEAQQHGL